MMYVTTPTRHTSPTRRLPFFALLSFLLLLLTVGLAPHAAHASTLTVTNTNDSGVGSLRAAIATANTDGDDTIQFSLPSGTYPQITLSSTLTITAPMTISGPDEGGPPAIIIDGGNSVQVFNIRGGTTVAPVVLSNLVVADGNAPPDGQTGGIFNDNSGGLGGGIYNGRGAVLTLTNCTITDNTVSAFVINPNDMSSGVGGGLYNDYGGTVTLTGCTLSRNSAPGSTGGGLYNNYGGTVTLTGCTLSRNSVDNGGEGGGIYTGGTATLTDCTFTNNSAQYDGVENPYYGIGGGLCVDEANATLTGCTFDGNRASNGGGIDHLGGNSDTVKLTNCTLTRNSAIYGGAIVTGSAGSSASLTDTLTNCTLTANSATGSGGGVYINVLHGSCILDNDILYGDTAPSNNEADATGTGQTVIATYCDIGQSNPLTGSAGDIDADPHFVDAPYQVTLKAGSPCIGAGDPTQAGKKDINGVVRFNPPTIGANEGYPLLVTNTNASGTGSLSGVLLAAQSAPDAVITFDSYFFSDFNTITPAATLELTQSVEIIAPDAGVAVSGGNSQEVFQVDSGVQAILTGLTITGGSGFFGGGLLNYGTATLTGCTLTGNSASDGGGIGSTSSTGALTLTDCTLTGNGADGGGAIAISGGTMTVTDCSLTGNTALIDGGAILDLHGALTATACSFTGNRVNSLTNDGAGGAICNVDGGTVTLDSDILYGDTAKSDTEITGPVSATYCDINQSGYTDIGDISVTPLFVAPPGNLQLQPNSPCIGKGDPSQAGTYDILGTLRPNPPSIGAYEGLPAATRTRLRSSSDSSIFGQSVTFTATVDNTTLGSHTFPAGSVVFYVNGIPTAAVSLTKVNGVATAVFTTSSLPAGTDFVTASLTGNSQFDSSSSDPLRHNVQAASTSTALTTYYNPSTVGEGCYFTATVANTSGTGALPTGSVAFYLNGSTTPFDTEPVDQYVSPGTASTLYTFTQPGTYTITAKYFGNSDFTGSSGSLSPSEQVNLNTPTVLVSANPSPSVYGQSVTFSVTVFGSLGSDSGVPNPTGTVTLQGLPGSPVVTLTHGAYPDTSVGSYTTSALPVGPDNYAAAYSGDSAYSNATVTGLSQTVSQAGATTGITSGQNPSTAGQSVTFTVTVAPVAPGAGTPTGSVTVSFGDGGSANVTLSGGTGTTSHAYATASNYTVTATYNGDTDFSASPAATLQGGQTVNLGPAAKLTLTAPANATAGQPFQATVRATDAYGNAVTSHAMVSFTSTDARAALPAPVSLTNGAATVTLTDYTAGAQTLTASASSLTSGTATTTVSSDAKGAPSISVNAITLTRGTGTNSTVVTVAFTLVNTGVGQASAVKVTVATLGTVSANSLPASMTIGAGQSQAYSLTFKNVPSGSSTLTLNGSYTGTPKGTTTSYAFSGGKKVTVP